MALFEFKSYEILGTEISQGKIVINSAAKKANIVKKVCSKHWKKEKSQIWWLKNFQNPAKNGLFPKK